MIRLSKKQLRVLIEAEVKESIFDWFGSSEKKKKAESEKRAKEMLRDLKTNKDQGESVTDYLSRKRKEVEPVDHLADLEKNADDMIDQLSAPKTKEEKIADLRKKIALRKLKFRETFTRGQLLEYIAIALDEEYPVNERKKKKKASNKKKKRSKRNIAKLYPYFYGNTQLDNDSHSTPGIEVSLDGGFDGGGE